MIIENSIQFQRRKCIHGIEIVRILRQLKYVYSIVTGSKQCHQHISNICYDNRENPTGVVYTYLKFQFNSEFGTTPWIGHLSQRTPTPAGIRR